MMMLEMMRLMVLRSEIVNDSAMMNDNLTL